LIQQVMVFCVAPSVSYIVDEEFWTTLCLKVASVNWNLQAFVDSQLS